MIGLSVPYRPRAMVVPTSIMPRREDAVFYQLYFQTPGVAEAEFERDVRQTFLKILGNAPRGAPNSGAGLSAWYRSAAAFSLAGQLLPPYRRG